MIYSLSAFVNNNYCTKVIAQVQETIKEITDLNHILKLCPTMFTGLLSKEYLNNNFSELQQTMA